MSEKKPANVQCERRVRVTGINQKINSYETDESLSGKKSAINMQIERRVRVAETD